MAKTDDRAGERQQGQMDIDPAFETDAQLAHAREPSMSALDYPTIASQPIVAFYPLAGDTRGDTSLVEVIAAAVDVVGLVGVQLARPALRTPRLASDRGQCINQLLEYHRVVPVGSGDTERQGNAVAVGDQVPLATELTAIGRVRPGVGAPRGAATLAASRLARLRSSLSARRSSANRT